MLIKLLGGIDFVGGLVLLFGIGFKIPYLILIPLGIIFLIKAGFGGFVGFGNFIDIGAGIGFFLLIFFNLHWIICVILGILVLQKGVFSLL